MTPTIAIHIILNRKTGGKLADAEVHFQEGPLQGLRLCGFVIWGKRKAEDAHTGTNVTFPKRSYQTRKNEKRDYMILRPQVGAPPNVCQGITGLILEAYEAERRL